MSIPLTQPPDKSITEDDWSETPDSVRAYVLKLVEQQGRNSRNSSQPPSQDSPRQKQEKQVEKPKSTRRRGAQDGHAGQGRGLMPADAVDGIVVDRTVVCQAGGERVGEGEAA